MKIAVHSPENFKIAEVISEEIVIKNVEDGLDLIGDLYYQEYDRIIIHSKNILPEFFDLKNGIAGEILQKFSNYRLRLVILGDFSGFTNKSIRDFIYESNRGKQINFATTISQAIQSLSTP